MNERKSISVLQTRIPAAARDAFVAKVQRFLADEYDVDLGNFDIEEILGFLCEKIGPLFYNLGVDDARTFVEGRLAGVVEDVVQVHVPEG